MKPEYLFLPCTIIIRWEGRSNKDEMTVLRRQVNLVCEQERVTSFILYVDPEVEESK